MQDVPLSENPDMTTETSMAICPSIQNLLDKVRATIVSAELHVIPLENPFGRLTSFSTFDSPFTISEAAAKSAIALEQMSDRLPDEAKKHVNVLVDQVRFREFLISPARNFDPSLVGFERGACLFPLEYDNPAIDIMYRDDPAQQAKALKGQIACAVQCFLGEILSEGHDAVRSLANPSLAPLSTQKRILLGVAREAIILHHFPDLYTFWQTQEAMRQEGRDMMFFTFGFDPAKSIEWAKALFDTQEERAMLDVLNEFGLNVVYPFPSIHEWGLFERKDFHGYKHRYCFEPMHSCSYC